MKMLLNWNSLFGKRTIESTRIELRWE